MLVGVARGYVRIALFFLLVGGLQGLLARVQLMQPGMAWVGGSELPGLLTLHAITLVLLSLVPLQTAGFLATLRGTGRPALRISQFGIGALLLGALGLYGVLAFQVANDGLAGLPVPRWLGGIGGKIPPIVPTDGPFVLALAGLCVGLVASALSVLVVGVSGMRAGQRVHGLVAGVTGLALAALFGSVVVGVLAHAAGESLGLARPLWWTLFDFFEIPAAWVLVAPLLWLVLYSLVRTGEQGSSVAVQLFGATALVLAGVGIATGSGAAPGYGDVLVLHLVFVGSLLFGGFGVLYELWPALFGRKPRTSMALAHWSMTLVTFAMLLAGMLGLAAAVAPRRIASVPELASHELWHMLASLGAFALGGAVVGGLALGLWSAPRVSGRSSD